MSRGAEDAILTLEPLIDAMREGIEAAGWRLSGLQKTTSHQFEGKWEGEATRSAYLFFHPPEGSDDVSVDVYLDETTRGLTGNLALVLDLVELSELGEPEEALRVLGDLSARLMPPEYATPLTLRLRLLERGDPTSAAETEVRFKLRIPKRSIAAGTSEIRRLAGTAIAAFERVRRSEELRRYIAG